jgi:hypothetical protein
VDACFETDQLGAALEQQVLPEAIAAVHLQREAAEVAQLLLPQAQERAALAPELTRRRRGPTPPWGSRRDGSVGLGWSRLGLLSQQSLQERDAHHAASLLTAPEALGKR